MSLDRHWYIAASSRELRREPLGRSVLGRPLVLFRGPDGRAAALEDRCLHRHVALSLGCVREGTIECPYHGWRYDTGGGCVGIPCAAPGEVLPRRRVASFPVVETESSIWVYVGEGAPPEAPSWPREITSYASFELVTLVDCPMLWVLNNFVDCAHTGFVHRGLFRSAPSRTVRAKIEETPRGVLIETFGESDSSSLASLLLVPRGETIRHTDELILPHTVRVDYRMGSARHIVTTSICTPETDSRTRITTRLGISIAPASRALVPVMRRLTRKILAQDKVILENQAKQIARFGRAFAASSSADAPTAWVTRAYDAMEAGSFPPPELRSKEVEYLL